MEPQINYSGAGGQPVYGKQKSGCGKFAVIGTIVLLLVIAGGSYLIYSLVIKAKEIVKIPDLNFGPPKENPENIDSRFTGSFMDAVLIPQKDGEPKLWILSDGSVKYRLRTRSPGKQTMGIACNDM